MVERLIERMKKKSKKSEKVAVRCQKEGESLLMALVKSVIALSGHESSQFILL
jgi:hypothetical protein